MKLNKKGFTLVEILMVIVLIAILAGVAITQFVNFQKDAKNNAVKANLQVLRRGIAAQNAQMKLRCGSAAAWPVTASLVANNIVTGADCTAAQVPTTDDRKFVAATVLPTNSWSGATAIGTAAQNAVTSCAATASCTGVGRAFRCGTAATARDATDGGWCYDPALGEIWANSGNNGNAGGVAAPLEYEF